MACLGVQQQMAIDAVRCKPCVVGRQRMPLACAEQQLSVRDPASLTAAADDCQLHASVTPSMPAYKGHPPVGAGVHDMPCVTCGRVTYVVQRRSPDVNPGKASLCWDECESSNFQVSSMPWLTAATGVAVLSF